MLNSPADTWPTLLSIMRELIELQRLNTTSFETAANEKANPAAMLEALRRQNEQRQTHLERCCGHFVELSKWFGA